MKAPKAQGETADQKAQRTAEEERIRVMQLRADADEQAAGRRLLTKKTRAVVRLFGARNASAGAAAGVAGGAAGGGFAGGAAGAAGDFPLGYEGNLDFGVPFFKSGGR